MDVVLVGLIIALFVAQTWLFMVMAKGSSAQMNQGLQNIRTELAEIISSVLDSAPVMQIADEMEPLQRLKGFMTLLKEFTGPPQQEPSIIESLGKTALAKDENGRFKSHSDD